MQKDHSVQASVDIYNCIDLHETLYVLNIEITFIP